MLDLDLRIVRHDWSSQKPAMPTAFTLVGYGSPHVLSADGRPPLVIDAEGVVLASGAVYTWCRTSCCGPNPRYWSSAEAAADFHGSYIVGHDGNITSPVSEEPISLGNNS